MFNNQKEVTRETLYHWILRRNTVTTKDILDHFNDQAGSKYIYIKYLHPLLNQGKIDRVRRGLYTGIDPITGEPVADRFIVASKIRLDYYLGYHTALDFYGSTYSYRSESQVCVKPGQRFREFRYRGVTYTPVYTSDTRRGIQTTRYRGHSIRVCGKERLLIECIDRPGHIGGWEQTLKSLQVLGGIRHEMIPTLLADRGSQKLIRKTGYILELLKDNSVFHSHLPDKVLDKLEGMVKGQPMYLETGRRGPLSERWQLYIPESFPEYLRGV
ncbi:MAG: type IV toxin-antitoxin system AbiEi family antitoxin [Candidatus Bathyarchaeia archaeon]